MFIINGLYNSLAVLDRKNESDKKAIDDVVNTLEP